MIQATAIKYTPEPTKEVVQIRTKNSLCHFKINGKVKVFTSHLAASHISESINKGIIKDFDLYI